MFYTAVCDAIIYNIMGTEDELEKISVDNSRKTIIDCAQTF